MAAKVIAELCQNHNGDVGLIKEMVSEAKLAGAEYAKLQTIDSSQLTHRERFDGGLKEGGKIKVINRPYKDEYSRLKGLDISDKAIEIFLEACKDNNIKPMTTIFTRDVIEKTFKQGFKAIKLASFDCNSYPLAKEIIANNPDLLIVSTGCSYKNEIEEMANIIRGIKNHAMLHCVSIYPTPVKEAHIARINYLSKLVNSVGLSDHSNYNKDGNTILKWAVCEGIEFLERHFTILGKEKTKDGAVSLNPNELSEAVAICNWSEEQKDTFKKENKHQESEIKGDSNRELSHVELLNRDYYQGRFASQSNQGEVIFNWDDSFNAKDIKHIK